MSYVFNMVGGSGLTSADAILTVKAPAGSTVAMTKGGITLTPTIWVQAADQTQECALFVIPAEQFDGQNAWTATASKGTQTKSTSVTINSNKQYSIMMDYGTDLFNNGTVYSGLGSFQNVTSTYCSNGVIGASSYDSSNGNYWTFANQIPFRSFGSTLHVLINVEQNPYPSDCPLCVGVFSDKPYSGYYTSNRSRIVATTSISQPTSNFVEKTVDISNLNVNSTYYLACIAIAKYQIKRIWITP